MTYKVAIFAPTPSGGHPEYVGDLASAMAPPGGSLGVIWPVRADLDAAYRLSNPSIRQIDALPTMPARPATRRFRDVLDRFNPLRRHDSGFVWWLLRVRQCYDAVLLEEIQRYTLWPLVRLCRSRTPRVVVHLHNVRRHDYSGSTLDRIDEHLTGRGLRSADLVLVHTEANARQVKELYGAKVSVRVIPHGVKLHDLSPQPTEGSPSVLFFGVNRANKGLEVLVKALATLEEPPMLVVAGVTPPERHSETVRVLSTVHHRWANGYVSESETRRLFRGASACVLPYTEFSAQSGVLHLAIGHGVPVVVTDVGGLADVVRAYHLGVVVPAADERALAEAVARITEPETNQEFRESIASSRMNLAWSELGPRYSEAVLGSVVSVESTRQ